MLTRIRASRHRAMRDGSRGFTLVELAVTITLLGILIAAGLPSFMAWIRNSQVRTVAETLQSGVRQAQTDALRLNQTVVLSLTNAAPALNSAAVANGKNWSIQTIALFDRVAVYVGGGKLTDVASNVAINGPAALCFNANGRVVDNATTGVPGATCTAGAKQFDVQRYDYVSASSGDRRLRVLVALGGQVRMCDPDRPTLSATSPDGCP